MTPGRFRWRLSRRFCYNPPLPEKFYLLAADRLAPFAPGVPDIMPTPHTDRLARRPVVLLVEDDADSREMYTTMLGFAGIDVHAAADAAAAFNLALAVAPDVIVTDFVLRGQDDGAALCRRLHADERTAHIPVLVVTGSTRQADTEALTGAGCADIRLKPYLPDAMVSDIERLLSGRRPSHAAPAH